MKIYQNITESQIASNNVSLSTYGELTLRNVVDGSDAAVEEHHGLDGDVGQEEGDLPPHLEIFT